MIKINLPISSEEVSKLRSGDIVSLSGYMYTARDAAHKRIVNEINETSKAPIDLEGQAVYYVGPSPAKPGQPIGSAGPTTSYRMDDLTIPLLERGLKIMIGKGKRADKVIESMKKNKAVYLGAVGGAGAYISDSIKEAEIIMYEDLGPEALRKIFVEDLVITVIIDSEGNNLYETGVEEYLNSGGENE